MQTLRDQVAAAAALVDRYGPVVPSPRPTLFVALDRGAIHGREYQKSRTDNTRGHPAHDPGRPGHQVAFAHYQALWKVAIGDCNTKVVSYRKPGDPVVER